MNRLIPTYDQVFDEDMDNLNQISAHVTNNIFNPSQLDELVMELENVLFMIRQSRQGGTSSRRRNTTRNNY